MKNTPKKITLIAMFSLLLLTSTAIIAQQHHLQYKLVKGNNTVGELSVVDTKSSDDRTIRTLMNAEVPAIVFDISLSDQKLVVYTNDILQSAIVTRNLFNNRPERSTTLLRNNIYTDGKAPLPAIEGRQTIDFSMSMLYTTEPKDKQHIYSEYHQQLVPVKRMSSHSYRIITPDGQTGHYYYENGICVKIDTKTTLATISTVLVTNNIAFK